MSHKIDNPPLPLLRVRIAVGLVSFAVIGLELVWMRELSIRFWHHFAHLVISVSLLGFGASGTMLVVLHDRVRRYPQQWLARLCILFAFAIPAGLWLSRFVPLNPYFLAWNPARESVNVLAFGLVLLLPFVLGGSILGVVLTDTPDRLNGHYAASLLGSGCGAFGTVLMMHRLGLPGIYLCLAIIATAAALLIWPWGSMRAWLEALAASLLLAGLLWMMPRAHVFSEYKMLPAALAMPDTQALASTQGPLGRLDVVSGPWVHHAPGVSLSFPGSIPPRVLVMNDGELLGAIYDSPRPDDWQFMDWTTSALPYHLRQPENVLVIGAGGGSGIGLARYHDIGRIDALEMNGQLIQLMTRNFHDVGGAIYTAPGVRVMAREARGYLASTDQRYDIIQLAGVGVSGASGAGLQAAHESYLHTVEAFARMWDRLSDSGAICITRWVRMPPRDGLKVVDTAVAMLRSRGLAPSAHMAVIRSWATVSVLISRQPLTELDIAAVRRFGDMRGFDLCMLPGLEAREANRYHVLAEPLYFAACRALAGTDDERDEFIRSYLFDIRAATDDKPYFHSFFRRQSLGAFREHFGHRGAAYVELGTLMLWIALLQTGPLAALLILLPLCVVRAKRLPASQDSGPATIPADEKGAADRVRQDLREDRDPPHKAVSHRTVPRQQTAAFATPRTVLLYFLLIGIGFMLLEMAFLQRLILYLAHPTYAAAVAIAAFLVFAGVGSELSGRWGGKATRILGWSGGFIVLLGLVYVFGLGPWLALTQAWTLPARCMVATITVAPLALAMGHMFPVALREASRARPRLVPFAWGVNGCASVVTTVSTPLLAMNFGFARVALLAVLCYALATMTALLARN